MLLLVRACWHVHVGTLTQALPSACCGDRCMRRANLGALRAARVRCSSSLPVVPRPGHNEAGDGVVSLGDDGAAVRAVAAPREAIVELPGAQPLRPHWLTSPSVASSVRLSDVGASLLSRVSVARHRGMAVSHARRRRGTAHAEREASAGGGVPAAEHPAPPVAWLAAAGMHPEPCIATGCRTHNPRCLSLSRRALRTSQNQV